MVYAEYVLKKEFGWTQAELESEPADLIEHYLHIIQLENERKATELKQAEEKSHGR